MFKKAVKYDAKLRLALCGPAGSGKTYSLLSIASELGGSIAYVDTEHGSASKYADLFNFDVIEPDVFDPRKLIEHIEEAIKGGYKVICIDSLSHYWMGTGGELDMVDSAAKKTSSGNSFSAWKNVTPIHNKLVDTIIGAHIHVLVAMRTKTEWVLEKDDRGKNVPRKIGLAPVMRDGIEFEFDVCGDLDQDNTLVVTKSRCPELAGKVINRPGKEMAKALMQWLAGASAEDKPIPPTRTDQPEEKGRAERIEDAQAVAQRKITDLKADEGGDWISKMMQSFGSMKELLGEDEYRKIMGDHGNKNKLMKEGRAVATDVYKQMAARAKHIKARQADLDELAELEAKRPDFHQFLGSECGTTWEDLQVASAGDITAALAKLRG